MGFALGDPRRCCYLDKSNIFDCRKSNLKVKTEMKSMVKVVKTVDACVKETKSELPTETSQQPVELKLPSSEIDKVKRVLMNQLSHDKLLEMVSIDQLICALAECHGYEKKQA